RGPAGAGPGGAATLTVMTSGNGNDRQRQRLVAEAVLGFLGFFTVLALVQAVWNLFRDEPSVGPSVLLLVLLVLTWLAWRWRRRL
ncbi:hypothetical protein ACUY2Q_10925, partial [Corynebacterium bovis]